MTIRTEIASGSMAARAVGPSRTVEIAFALALGPMATTGIARFAYALILPAMRTDLAWTYTQAGWMNTANGLGYLLGAIISLRLARSVDPRKLFVSGMVLTALMLIASGTVRQFQWLFALRPATGIASAVGFVGGGALAAQVGPPRTVARADTGRTRSDRWPLCILCRAQRLDLFREPPTWSSSGPGHRPGTAARRGIPYAKVRVPSRCPMSRVTCP